MIGAVLPIGKKIADTMSRIMEILINIRMFWVVELMRNPNRLMP